MKRREFLAAAAATSLAPWAFGGRSSAQDDAHAAHGLACGPTYASPSEAMQAARETLAFVPAIQLGARNQPDYLAVVDVEPTSATYGQVVHRLYMPTPGDELHHYGWNACSSCHGDAHRHRRYIVLPGLNSGRIHIIDAADPRHLKLHKVIEADQIKQRANLSAPHTVHCLNTGQVMISMLGDAQGNAPGGFLLLDEQFEVVGRWDQSDSPMQFNYDFSYRPQLNMMVSSQWAAPQTVRAGFKLEDVQAGKYGRSLHFWNWQQRRIEQTLDLGPDGMIPLEVRMQHRPDSDHGFVGAALSSAMWHFHRPAGAWQADKVIQVEPVELADWPFPVPGLITDLVLSLDDRWLYFSNWLHGDLRQYDVSDPTAPKLTAQVWLGGLLGKGQALRGKPLVGGPQMLQLSLDGRRLYVTSSLYTSWDDQFYPGIAEHGSFLLQLNCDSERGGMELNEDFFVDFGQEPDGPVRAHEVRFPGGDCTSDIWV